MLEAKDLWKRYGSLTAVAGVSLTLKPGEIVGLLGPNGAGKTTTVSMLCGLTSPDQGEVTIEGARLGEDAFDHSPGVDHSGGISLNASPRSTPSRLLTAAEM